MLTIQDLKKAVDENSVQRIVLGEIEAKTLEKEFGKMVIDGTLALYGNILIVGNKNATIFDVIQKIDKSVKGKVNKITYLRGK